jgi:predicted nucleic acid-binding protein
MLIALMDEDDAWHARARDWFAATTDHVVVPSTVVQETAYLLGDRQGPRIESGFLRAVASGEFRFEPVNEVDIARAADLVDAYADFPLGFVDASIVAVAERLDISSLLTTDRKHFGVVRPVHCKRFKLLP